MLSPNELREKADFLDGKNFGKSKSDEIVAELCRQVAEMQERTGSSVEAGIDTRPIQLPE